MPRTVSAMAEEWVDSWNRAWSNGEDVSLEHPSTWPDLFRVMYVRGWRPTLRSTESRTWPDPGTIQVSARVRSRAGRGAHK